MKESLCPRRAEGLPTRRHLVRYSLGVRGAKRLLETKRKASSAFVKRLKAAGKKPCRTPRAPRSDEVRRSEREYYTSRKKHCAGKKRLERARRTEARQEEARQRNRDYYLANRERLIRAAVATKQKKRRAQDRPGPGPSL